MTIIRAARPESQFTIIRNEVLYDMRLSNRAIGVLVRILGRPDNWETSAERMVSEGIATDERGGVLVGKEGREAILTAFVELRTVGYMRTVRVRGERGRIESRTLVFDSPQDAERAVAATEVGLTGAGQADSGPTRGDAAPDASPGSAQPGPVNPTRLQDDKNKNYNDPREDDDALIPAASLPDNVRPIKPERAKPEQGRGSGRKTRMPDGWAPNAGHREYAHQNGLNVSWEAEQFRDWVAARGETYVDWDAAFRTRLRNAVKWSGGRSAAPAPVRPGAPRRWDQN